MRFSCIQLEVRSDEAPALRLSRALASIAEEAAAGARIILLPEMWLTGFFAFDRYAEEAEALDGATGAALARAARESSVTLIAGSLLERDRDALHNTAVAFSPSGELLAAYRKIHLFGYQSRESELLSAGGDVCVFDAEGARIGLSTCYDLRFPELYRAQIDKGADVLAVVSAWPFPRIDAWRTLARARAIESQAGLIACNAAGGRYLGHSCAFDAWGAVLGELDERAGTLRADLDVAEIRKARAEFPALADRRLG